jgi:hypothetical protein
MGQAKFDPLKLVLNRKTWMNIIMSLESTCAFDIFPRCVARHLEGYSSVSERSSVFMWGGFEFPLEIFLIVLSWAPTVLVSTICDQINECRAVWCTPRCLNEFCDGILAHTKEVAGFVFA